MAGNLPNIAAYVEAACRDPSLLGNIEFLVEDFMSRLKGNSTNSCCSQPAAAAGNTRTETADTEQQNKSNASEPASLFNVLIQSARKAMEEMNTDSNPASANNSKIQSPTSQPDPDKTTDIANQETTPLERIIPIRTNTAADYEFKFNFEGCPSDSIKLDIEDGILRATAKKEGEEGVKTISYEKKLPSDVDTSTLKATFLGDGTLKIAGKKAEDISSPIIVL